MSKVRKRSILIQKRIKILSSCQKNTIHPFPNLKCHQNILTDKIIIIISKRTLSIYPPLNTQNFQLWFFLYKSNLWTKYFQNLWNKQKKNTLTGPVNCKKTTRHHAPLSLCAKSRTTNDAKSRKWPKTSNWTIFWQFRGQIPRNCKFFWKIVFSQIEGLSQILVLISGQKPKKLLQQFLWKISKCLILG